MGILTKILDHAALARARILSQFRNSPKFNALVSALTFGAQPLEDALWDMFPHVKRGILNATGAQLDVIGRIVGQTRGNSADDTEFRNRLLGRVKANLSDGTAEKIYAVFGALLASTPGATAEIEDGPPAGFIFRIDQTALDPDLVSVYRDYLLDSKAAGVYAVLEWTETLDPGSFIFPICAFMDVGGTATEIPSTVPLDDFPLAGSLRTYANDGSEEEVTYNYRDQFRFYEVDPPLAGVYDAGALVEWIDSPGLGMGDKDIESVGGALAGAVRAHGA